MPIWCGWVRKKAEVNARFNLNDTPHASAWLKNNDLENNSSDDGECLLRRTISKEGRSRAYINGTPVSLSQLKSLGQLLVNIHGPACSSKPVKK